MGSQLLPAISLSLLLLKLIAPQECRVAKGAALPKMQPSQPCCSTNYATSLTMLPRQLYFSADHTALLIMLLHTAATESAQKLMDKQPIQRDQKCSEIDG